MKKTLCVSLSCLAAAAAQAVVPEVSDVNLSQDRATREVTITYRLSAPAVVTLDIVTNGPNGWTSIGADKLSGVSSGSDVWRKVSGKDVYTISWQPRDGWADQRVRLEDGGIKAVVTAWALDNTPDYMVVDISPSATAESRRYYPSAAFLPGGLFGDDAYRTSKLVMRRIRAKNRPWTMGVAYEWGGPGASQKAHPAVLTNDFYIGVFEVTQGQWKQLMSYNPSAYRGDLHPVDQVSYNEIRCGDGSNSTTYRGGNWPAPPNSGSFLDVLNSRTGLDFDLPSEAEWEFAGRAGQPESHWNDGSEYRMTDADVDANLPGCYKFNDGYRDVGTVAVGHAVVGSYAPNAWGVYDMHGNMFELCLDWYAADITGIGGAVNIDPANGANALSTKAAGSNRVRRGGAWHCSAKDCRLVNRLEAGQGGRASQWGFRVVCRAGLR